MSSWARVGAKCVCVDDVRRPRLGEAELNIIPPKGAVCQIVGMSGGNLVIFEFPNYCPNRRRDIGWKLSRFRPLVSQEDDISMFKSLLKPTEVSA